MPEARLTKFWLLVCLLVPFYLTWTFDHSLWNPDETRDAGMASEMFRTGEYMAPKLNGEIFLEKPPLYYWCCAAVYKLTGVVSEGTTRLPAAIGGILGILFTFLIGKFLFNERAGLLAAAILATTGQYFRMSHFALMDTMLAAFVTGALYFHLRGSKVGLVMLTLLGFYAKGFLAIVLVGMVVVPHLLLEKRMKDLALTLLLGMVAFAALVIPWFAALWKEGGRRYLEIFLIDNHWKRFVSHSADHTGHSWFYYLASFPVDFLPWTIFFVGLLVDLCRRPFRYRESSRRRFLLLWFFGMLFFFSLSSSKRNIYLLPLFPAAALLSAVWLDEFVASKPNAADWYRRLALLFGTLAVLIGGSSFILASRLDKDKTFIPVYEAAKSAAAGGPVAGFDMSEMERGVFNFYHGGTLPDPKDIAELRVWLVAQSGRPFSLIVNRTRWDEVKPVLEGKARPVFEYRPDKKTRSYVVCAG